MVVLTVKSCLSISAFFLALLHGLHPRRQWLLRLLSCLFCIFHRNDLVKLLNVLLVDTGQQFLMHASANPIKQGFIVVRGQNG